MKRLTLIMVFCGLVIAWRLAGSPTLRSPFFRNATTEGVVRLPSSLAITTGSLPSITATQLFVVPRSIPIIFAINYCLFTIGSQCLCQGRWGEILSDQGTEVGLAARAATEPTEPTEKTFKRKMDLM